MDVCDTYNVKALFFLDFAEAWDYGCDKIKEVVKLILKRGHDIGVHIHPDHMLDKDMSRAENPHDNAVMESFWGRFKDTLRKHFRYWESDDLRATIEQAIYYFNNERPVRKLKGKPPVLYRTELVA